MEISAFRLTNTQRVASILGIGATIAWHCLNGCQDRGWQRVMFVSAAASLIAQALLAGARPKPDVDPMEQQIKSSSERDKSWVAAPVLVADWHQQRPVDRHPYGDYVEITCQGLVALVGPVFCIVATKKKWCVPDEGLSIGPPQMVEGMAFVVGITALGIFASLYRRYLVRVLCMKWDGH